MSEISLVEEHVEQRLNKNLEIRSRRQQENLTWLRANMNPYFLLQWKSIMMRLICWLLVLIRWV